MERSASQLTQLRGAWYFTPASMLRVSARSGTAGRGVSWPVQIRGTKTQATDSLDGLG